MKLISFFLLLLSFSSFGEVTKNAYLSEEDQKYFKNNVFEGNNQFGRINMNVKEINRLHGELAALKAEVQALKKDVEELKKGK